MKLDKQKIKQALIRGICLSAFCAIFIEAANPVLRTPGNIFAVLLVSTLFIPVFSAVFYAFEHVDNIRKERRLRGSPKKKSNSTTKE